MGYYGGAECSEQHAAQLLRLDGGPRQIYTGTRLRQSRLCEGEVEREEVEGWFCSGSAWQRSNVRTFACAVTEDAVAPAYMCMGCTASSVCCSFPGLFHCTACEACACCTQWHGHVVVGHVVHAPGADTHIDCTSRCTQCRSSLTNRWQYLKKRAGILVHYLYTGHFKVEGKQAGAVPPREAALREEWLAGMKIAEAAMASKGLEGIHYAEYDGRTVACCHAHSLILPVL